MLLPLEDGVEGGMAGMTVQCLRLGSSVSTYSMLSQADSPSLSVLPRSHWPLRSRAWSWLYPRQQTSSVTSVSPMVVVVPVVVTLLRDW